MKSLANKENTMLMNVEVVQLEELAARLKSLHLQRTIMLASRAFGSRLANALHAELHGEQRDTAIQAILLTGFTEHGAGKHFDADVDRFVQHVMGWKS